MRKRLRARLIAGACITFALSSSTVHATLSGPGCIPINGEWGLMLRNFVPTTSAYDCSLDGQHGNYGGAYANGFFNLAGQYTSIPCTSISSRAVYGLGGALYNAPRSYRYSVGGWSSSTGPSGSGLFASVFWATRPGLYDDSTTVFVQGLNC